MDYMPDFRKFFYKQVPDLLALLERIAGALEQRITVGLQIPAEADSDKLLHRLYLGYWESAGEMVKNASAEYALIGKDMVEQEEALRMELTEEQWTAVEKYGNTVMRQASESIEQAFVAGAKLVMGIVVCGLPAAAAPVTAPKGGAQHAPGGE